MTRWTEQDLARIQNLNASLPSRAFKPSKYRNEKVKADGYTFDSKAEHRHYQDLKLLERAGRITELEIHERFPIVIDGTQICVYESDFTYRDDRGDLVVVDVKGVRTPLYQLKRKLMKAVLGIDIVEIS